MSLEMSLDVHAHKGSELNKSGVDAPPFSGIAAWNPGDQVPLEPINRLALCQPVDLGRVNAHVDGASHKSHAARLCRITGLRHHCPHLFSSPSAGPQVANGRSLRNFPMQANGAEMLRLACCLGTEKAAARFLDAFR
jgi:hypothetical protein